MLQFLYFLIRHTPFWAIPVIIISAEFCYVYWLRRKKIVYQTCILMASISIFALAYYYWAGGPEKAVRKLIVLLMDYSFVNENYGSAAGEIDLF
jgi:hypothetical protein